MAAALPTVGETALQGLRDYCGVTLPGSKEWGGEGSYKGHVLVVAGSGGVGHMAVQVGGRGTHRERKWRRVEPNTAAPKAKSSSSCGFWSLDIVGGSAAELVRFVSCSAGLLLQ